MATRNFSRLFAAVARSFQKASEDDLRDLEDALDIPVHGDAWNSQDGRTENNPRGALEAASGEGGQRMVNRYSDPQPQTGVSADYVNARFEEVEKALTAVAQLIAESMKAGNNPLFPNQPFPRSDEAKFSYAAKKAEDDEADDDSDESEDEADAEKALSGKGVLTVGGVPGLMRQLSKKASQPVKELTLRQPPNMAVIKKSHFDLEAALYDKPFEVRTAVQSCMAQAQALSSGIVLSPEKDQQMRLNLRHNIGRAPRDAQMILANLGIG